MSTVSPPRFRTSSTRDQVGPERPGSAGEAMGPLGRTLGMVRPAAGRLALATGLGAAAVAAAIGLMGTSAWLISRASQRPMESALAIGIVAVEFCGLSRGIFRYTERLVGHDAAFRLLADLRVRVYQSLETQAPVGLVDFRRGDLLARLVGDVDTLQDLVLRVIPPFAIALGVGSATVATVWWMLPGAGAVLAVCLLVAATAVPWLTGSLAQHSEQRQAAVRGQLATSVLDLVEGVPDLVVYGATDRQLRRIADADDQLTKANARSANTVGVGLALTTLCAGAATWGGLVLGVPAVHGGSLNPVLLAVIALVPLAAFELVAGLPVATQSLQGARRAAGRIFEVLDATPPLSDPVSPAPMPRSTSAPDGGFTLSLRSVVARYPRAPEPALFGVDLDLAPGRRLAVVGPSGAGKSTLAAVVLRFLPYEAGSVCLEGTELDTLAADQVREVVGLVTQDAHLFDTTVAENLRVGRRAATDGELEEMVARVGLREWLASLPQGLATEVGPRGNRVSGGQRQRLALARALLADFPILVLDEPGEHLEPEAADALTEDLLAVTGDRSTVLITHRLSGLEGVDEIMVLVSGQAVERGTHHELLAARGHYARMWGNQMATERSQIR